jgi:hypothetical protein
LVVVHRVWLLLYVLLCCYSLCFVAAHCVLRLLLFRYCFMFNCCSYFATLVTSLLHGCCHSSTLHCSPTLPNTSLPLVAFLILHASLLLNVLLLLCPNWYFTPHFPLFARCWRFTFGID